MAAFTQLIVYLGSLRQSRLSRNRSDTSVYGVASDGYVFGFVAITHDGLLLQSRLFDITRGDLPKVLGCLKYLLEKSASMSPNLTPDKKMGYPSKGDDGGDPAIDLDDDSDDDDSDDDDSDDD
ncbi:hypothetical protein BS47DRAFT_281589 [Hydnum rufescens UP504]|uniref:Uncharacterized protein n=1 Tax=Hydnum rufescens UP504 TaxID=1448309 RepID=A0A9P6DRI8_9AGAM|nr:hypothetical protein BS47DRAFT_281589 [Hydnum rufescens UP504]